MTATVHRLPCDMTDKPDVVLFDAKTRGLTDVVVIGWDAEGELYMAASTGKIGDQLLLLELAKKALLD